MLESSDAYGRVEEVSRVVSCNERGGSRHSTELRGTDSVSDREAVGDVGAA